MTRVRTVVDVPWYMRLWFYGMHGIFDEVMFTALFDVFLHHKGNRKLIGYSSIFSFLIYGSCAISIEYLYRNYLRHHTNRIIRIPIYVAAVYLWEFSCGYILTLFGLCSWDYTHYEYDVMGLICAEYLPAWAALSWWQDVLFDLFYRLHIAAHPNEEIIYEAKNAENNFNSLSQLDSKKTS